MPGLAATSANATDPEDYGVASGMRGTISQIGVTAGIQTMVIALGAERTSEAFASSYALGLTVACLGLVISLAIKNTPRRVLAPAAG